jgi:quercetin 2,3-dioxygenase
MTAASGILHEEFHSPQFTSSGGTLEMAQLWVNLPARHKMAAPRYQTIASEAIPAVALPDLAGHVRVIAGHYADCSGPAETFTELNVWDVRMAAGCAHTFRIPEGHTAALAVFKGVIGVNDSSRARRADLVVLDRAGSEVKVQAGDDAGAVALMLSGVPIAEPVVGHGPFVMNSRQEIETAMRDFQDGKFGRMPPARAGDTELARS